MAGSTVPDNRISGGKILSVRTRHVQNRVALALRIAAHNNDNLARMLVPNCIRSWIRNSCTGSSFHSEP